MTTDVIVTVLGALGTLLAGLGAKELIQRYVTRRGERADAAAAERKEVSAVSAQGNFDVLRLLLEETKSRVDSYEQMIVDLKADHAADIRELKTENKSLERQVADLRQLVQDYQLGSRVPRGMVLVPAQEIRALRESHPGLLLHRWYPGELEANDEASSAGGHAGPAGGQYPGAAPGAPRSITAQITRLDGPDER